MKQITIAGAILAMALGSALAQTAVNPAAKTHVRVINNVALKYTSKLTHVVELNFTFGNTHTDGKQIITAGLDRIMKSYAVGGKDAFTIKKFTTGNSGSAVGELSNFTLSDLTSGEVIVTNNISYFNQLQTKSAAQATAFETAVKTEGRGVLGFHGTGDGGGGWAFYTNDYHPVGYNGHGSRIDGSVYKNTATAKHVILQNILETGTTAASVPMSVDASGNEVVEAGVKTRLMKNEWYKFSRNLTTDAKYAPLTTPLLKYDPRNLGGALEPQYRYKGGNLYTFLLKVGNGKVSYVPAGHSNDELMASGTTFDGGTGDYDRYVAQSLFFLAGYKTEVCNSTNCTGLPIVNAQDHLTGEVYPGGGTALFDSKRMAFTSFEDIPYEAKLTDVTGRVVAVKRGMGKARYTFDESPLKAGIYFITVKLGRNPAKSMRYVVAQGR